MQPGPSPTETDELRGLAWLVVIGALALAPLAAAGVAGGTRRGSGPPTSERGVTVGTLPRFDPASGAPASSSATATFGGATAQVSREDDPQMLAFQQSFRGGVDAGLPQPFTIAYHHGTLVSAAGVDGLVPGARCEVRVLPVRSHAFNCLLRVTCGDVVIYPDDALRAGYAPCEIEGSEAVSAIDDSSTDGDREIRLDVRRRSVLVQEHALDGAPLLEARVRLES